MFFPVNFGMEIAERVENLLKNYGGDDVIRATKV
jgi:hypothetical protein